MLPWWVGVILAAVAYVGLHRVAASDVAAVAAPGKGHAFASLTLAAYGQYLLPCFFLVVAGLSAYGRYTRRALNARLEARSEWGALNTMSGRQFEALVGEAFLRKGYAVTGTGGADSGGGLVLRMKGETFLVQCKQWRALQVGVNTVREIHEMMAAKGAAGGFVVTSGVFTQEALAFARGKPVELMDGKALHALIRGVSVPARILRDPLSVMTTGAPFCPECQSRMVKRKASRGANAGKAVWSCARYPDCKGMREV